MIKDIYAGIVNKDLGFRTRITQTFLSCFDTKIIIILATEKALLGLKTRISGLTGCLLPNNFFLRNLTHLPGELNFISMMEHAKEIVKHSNSVTILEPR